MPFLRLTLNRAPDAAQREALAATLTELVAAVLGKSHRLAALAIEVVPDWWIGAAPLAARDAVTALLEVKVTRGTNSAEEKAAFIERAWDALRELLGPLETASYIVIDEVPAESWGYAGRTQQARRTPAEAAATAP